MTREPLLSTGGWTSAVAALVGVLAIFGLNVPPAAQLAITGVVAVVAPVVVAVLARRKVTPNVDPRTADGTPLVAATITSPPAT